MAGVGGGGVSEEWRVAIEQRVAAVEAGFAALQGTVERGAEDLGSHMHPHLEAGLENHQDQINSLRTDLGQVEQVTTSAVADLADQIANLGTGATDEAAQVLKIPEKTVEAASEEIAPKHHHRIL